MTITADVFDFAIFLIGLGFFIFVIALVPALLQLKRTFKAVEELTAETKKTVEVVNFIAKRAQDQVVDFEELITRVKDLGVKVTGLGDIVVDNVKGPIISFLSFLFGAEEGFKRFFHRNKKGGGKDEQL
jgi:uncharacterized protein YoxC